jgi:serralysin
MAILTARVVGVEVIEAGEDFDGSQVPAPNDAEWTLDFWVNDQRIGSFSDFSVRDGDLFGADQLRAGKTLIGSVASVGGPALKLRTSGVEVDRNEPFSIAAPSPDDILPTSEINVSLPRPLATAPRLLAFPDEARGLSFTGDPPLGVELFAYRVEWSVEWDPGHPLLGDGMFFVPGSRWERPVTFSFPDTASDYGASAAEQRAYEQQYNAAGGPMARGVTLDFANDFAQVTPAQMQAVRAILTGTSATATTLPSRDVLHTTAVAQFTNLQLTDAGFDTADIRIADHRNQKKSGFAWPPGDGIGGDVWLDPTNYANPAPALGNGPYAGHLHELGHALGLLGDDQPAAKDPSMEGDEYTVMSYITVPGVVRNDLVDPWSAPQSFMMLDIAALQHLYGANYGYNAGDTRYTWDLGTGEMSINGILQGRPGSGLMNDPLGGPPLLSPPKIFLTVWDGGGRDTYDMSNYSTGVSIDLQPGSWSVTSPTQRAILHWEAPTGTTPAGTFVLAKGNVYNALLHNDDPRSLIEDAVGGMGSDEIRGNQADNLLNGGPGPGGDALTGGPGRDTFLFIDGFGQDRVLDFRQGEDVLRFLVPGVASTRDLTVRFLRGPDPGDVLRPPPRATTFSPPRGESAH